MTLLAALGAFVPLVLLFGLGMLVGDRIPPPVQPADGLPSWMTTFIDRTPNLVLWVVPLFVAVGTVITVVQSVAQ